MKNALSVILLINFLVFTSCEKESTSSVSPTTNTEKVNISFSEGDFLPTDGKGVLGLTNTYTSSFTMIDSVDIQTEFSSGAAAIFYNSLNDQIFLNAGDIFLNDDTVYFVDFFGIYLNYSNNLYFSNGLHWKITGNDTTGVPAMDYQMSLDTPTFNIWNIKQNYTKADGININFNGSFSNTDTLIAVVESEIDPENNYSKPFSPRASSLNFLASELVSIPSGPVRIRIRALNYTPKTFGGKKYYFLTELERSINASID